MKPKRSIINLPDAGIFAATVVLVVYGILFTVAYGLHQSVSSDEPFPLYKHSGDLPVDATNFRLLWQEKFR